MFIYIVFKSEIIRNCVFYKLIMNSSWTLSNRVNKIEAKTPTMFVILQSNCKIRAPMYTYVQFIKEVNYFTTPQDGGFNTIVNMFLCPFM